MTEPAIQVRRTHNLGYPVRTLKDAQSRIQHAMRDDQAMRADSIGHGPVEYTIKLVTTPREIECDERGCGILTVNETLDSLKYCIESDRTCEGPQGTNEDALAAVISLLKYLVPDMAVKDVDGQVVLQGWDALFAHYGRFPALLEDQKED